MSYTKLVVSILLASRIFAAETIPGAENSLIVHEWGTFTSVAGADGNAVPWTALAGPADLPCFVIRPQLLAKAAAFARVRMETPVVYFYSPRPITASLNVNFRNGALTEWYPQAAHATPGRLEWKTIEVRPGEDLDLPTGHGDSHYYAARETDSAPLRVGDQQEKLLFYRGVGDFDVPMRPHFTPEGAVDLQDSPATPAILFENRGGRIGYRLVTGRRVEPPALTGDLMTLRAALVDLLTDAGLYANEARAMVETWRDSWFEEGMRLLYIVPRQKVDDVLPIEITPGPRALTRVFVGRVELLSPAMRQTIGRAMTDGDIPALQRFGRFINAFAGQRWSSEDSPKAKAFLDLRQGAAYSQSSSRSCIE
jgi:hypothetical protein